MRRNLRRLSVSIDEVALVRRALFESGLIPHRRTMVDVGAHKGSAFSSFVRSGWQVWAFEPNTVLYEDLVERFGHWPNLSISPVALSDEAQQQAAFFVSEESTGISSLLGFDSTHRFSEFVATRRLDAFAIDYVDLLKIDVEGYDRNVFRSRGSLVPRVLVTEFEDNKTKHLGYSAEEYALEIEEAGYDVWMSEWDPIVRYGRRHSWRRLVRFPDFSPDVAAWGNFIAVHRSVEIDPVVIDRHLHDELGNERR